jgi:hypothetical protein
MKYIILQKIQYLFVFVLVLTACQPGEIAAEVQPEPPWLTPASQEATQVLSTAPTRMPLVIPERTTIPFRTIEQEPHVIRGSGSQYLILTPAVFNQPALFSLTTPEDISQVEAYISPETRESLLDIDYSETMAAIVYGGSQFDYGNAIQVRMIFLHENNLQMYAVNEETGTSFQGYIDGSLENSPFHEIRFDKELIPDSIHIQLYIDSQLVSETDVQIR